MNNTTTTNSPASKLAEVRPRCAVRGMVRPGAVCGKVIVGMEFCGYSGECPHKVLNDIPNTVEVNHG